MRNFILIGLLLISTPAWAQNYDSLLQLPEGATLMTVSATERTEVKQDLLTATLRFQAENTDAATLQDQINTVMTQALAQVAQASGVQASTLNYNVYQYDPNRGKDGTLPAPIWRGEQSLQIKSTDTKALLDLTGALQKTGLMVNGLGYSVSPALREETHSALLENALAKLTAKAQRAGKALNKGTVSLLQVDVGQDGPSFEPPMMMRAMAMDGGMEKMASPVATPGESEITLNVSAMALLKP